MVINTSIKGTKALSKQLKDLGETIEHNTSDELQKSVFILERNIVTLAPVDTGRYRLGWRVIKYGQFEYEIRNAVSYATVLIYGGGGRGMIHDVRGIVRYWRNHIYKKAIANVKGKL